MKKVLLLLGVILLYHFVDAQCTFTIELSVDGNSIKTSTGTGEALVSGDLTFTMTNLRTGCVINNAQAKYLYCGEFNPDQQVIMIDADEHVSTMKCANWIQGDEMEFKVEVSNPAHKFYGYKGEGILKIKGASVDAFGGAGLNLTKGPELNVAVDLASLTLCQGATSGNKLTATVTNAEGVYTVEWKQANGNTIPGLGYSGANHETANFSGVTAGDYMVVAMVGAVKSAEIPVTVKPLPTTPTIKVDPTIACAGEDVTVSVTNVQTDVKYTWTPTHVTDGPTAAYKATNGVLYSVVPDLNGCAGTKSNEVSVTIKPEISIQGDPTINCKVDHYEAVVVVNGTGNFSAYTDLNCTNPVMDASWNVTKKSVTFTKLDFGAHTFYIKGDQTCGVADVTVDDNGSCACGAHLAIAMPEGNEFCAGATAKPIKITLTCTNEFKTCSFDLKAPDGTVVLPVNRETATTGKTWSYTPTQSGIYTLENFNAYDTDGNNCGEITLPGTVTVTINPKPTLQSFTVSKNEGCYEEELHLEALAANGTAPYEYIWTGTGTSGKQATIDMTIQAGDNGYKVQAKDAKGCLTEQSEEKHVVGHRVVVTAVATPQNVVNGTSTTLVPTVTLTPTTNRVTAYLWTPQDKIDGGLNTLEKPATVKLTGNQTYTVVVTDDHHCTGQATTTVNVTGTELAVTATGGSECYGKTLTLGCVPTGGTGDGVLNKYDYEWKVSEGLVLSDVRVPDPTVDITTKPGTYTATVVVSDDANTVTSEVVNVIVKRTPKLTNILASPSTGLNSVSSNLTVTVEPTDDVSLAWKPVEKILSGGDSNSAQTQLLTESTTFIVKASLEGCFDEKSVEVVVTTQNLTLTAEGSEGCSNTQLTVEAKPVGGVPNPTTGYTYSWGSSTPLGVVLSSTTAKKPFIQNSAALQPGTYSIPVTVTDSKNQTKTANAVVTIYGNVVAEGLGICKPEDRDVFDGQIKLSKGTVPYTIYSDAGATNKVVDVIWNAAGTEATLENLTSGNAYTYYVKDKNGCNTARVDLTADCKCGAQLVMTVGTQVCALSGDDINITLLASGGTSYSFDLVNVELGTTVKQVRNETETSWTVPVKYADRGKYRVDNFEAVTDVGTCEGNVVPKEVEVKFFATPKVEAGEDQKVCGTGTVILKANGDAGLTYQWDNDVQDGVPFTPPMGVPTTYTVRGTDANGCWKEDQLVVSANLKPTVSAMATPNVVCRGEVVNLSHNGTADTYEWDNGGQNGPNNMPETTTRYTVEGTSTATGCKDTSSVLVIVNLPAEIVERPKDRTIAIGKDVSYTVKAIGNNLTYQWQWYNAGADVWTSFTDNTATSPKVSGATTETLLLETVPESWDGRKVKCIVKGDCGDPQEAQANLWVKECFDIVADIQMGEGIRPEGTPGAAVDGWYCKGNRIALKALVNLADPENGSVANPHFTWTIDGLPAEKVIESDSSVLSWVPEYYEDDIVVRVCVYSDGACDPACSKHLRLKARTPDEVRMQIVTSVDPDRMFCPGDSVDFTVALKNDGQRSEIHWYRDIFNKGTGRNKRFVMDQKDTWVKAVFEPSAEMCVEREISDSVFLRVKEYVQPTLRIENNIHDTIACQGDTLLFHAIRSNAGEHPELRWQQDIWERGTGEYAVIGLNDKDTWVKCILTPGNDVCYSGPVVMDSMVIRVREAGTLTISTDMTDKHLGDELTFVSEVEGMNGTWGYNWYVNGNQTTCEEEDYITDLLRQGDVVEASISGNEVCLNKIFSNKIRVDYAGFINRDTMLVIYEGERIKNLDMLKPGDDIGSIVFRIDIPANYGMASFTPNGKFTYIPNTGFIGTDYVKYVIVNKFDKEVIAEGYIYITVKDSKRFLIPNLITPNDDGLNDTWKLDFLADYPDHRITIFDRNGHIVLESTNYQNDWDGSGFNKGGYVAHTNLLNGVYTYVIELGDKEKTVLKSWIEIRANLNRRNYR